MEGASPEVHNAVDVAQVPISTKTIGTALNSLLKDTFNFSRRALCVSKTKSLNPPVASRTRPALTLEPSASAAVLAPRQYLSMRVARRFPYRSISFISEPETQAGSRASAAVASL